jgi:hypothetical protein
VSGSLGMLLRWKKGRYVVEIPLLSQRWRACLCQLRARILAQEDVRVRERGEGHPNRPQHCSLNGMLFCFAGGM